jgi:hypothetical protein
MVTHMRETLTGNPGVELATWASPQTYSKTLYPADMIQRGYIYVRADEAANLRVGDALQVDRTHAVVAGVERPETVEDYSTGAAVAVDACKVLLGELRYV